jgi:sialic acid synthase
MLPAIVRRRHLKEKRLMPREFAIDGVVLNDNSDCFVIAELGHNHQGELEKCKEMIRVAKECGADAVKLQKRDNRSLYTRELYDSPYLNRNSYGATYGQHREFLEFGRTEYEEIKHLCRELGIMFFATAFDIPSADFLAELDMPAFKVASGDLTNVPLLKYVAGFGKPVIFSTGGGRMQDVQPADYDQLNLRVIETYRNAFPDALIGYSSHDNSITMPIVAYMLGARVIEKHFTLNRTWKGTDQVFSLAPDGLRRMVRDLKRTRLALGSSVKEHLPVEDGPMFKMKKKIVAARDLPAGHKLVSTDIAFKSPGDGLAPYEADNVIGKTIVKPLAADATIRLEDLT